MSTSPLDNPNFVAWFGDSKVVDSAGRPLIVFHGTRHDIVEFQVSESGLLGAGAYFTNDPVDAEEYAYSDNGGDNVMPVYLRIRNPLVISASGGWAEIALKATGKIIEDVDEPGDESLKEVMQALFAQGYDGIISRAGKGGPTHYWRHVH